MTGQIPLRPVDVEYPIVGAEVWLRSDNIQADIDFFRDTLGFKLNEIFPADYPRTARMSGYGLQLRLEVGKGSSKTTLRLQCIDDPDYAEPGDVFIAPNGTHIEFAAEAVRPTYSPIVSSVVVERLTAENTWKTGRVGFLYRDLVPGRLGGMIIASQIRIPGNGPVEDSVHFHHIDFQLIHCLRGSIRLVYEDQGPPFVLEAGAGLIQPSGIRHQVLESWGNAEVLELAVPAEHSTMIDHEMVLPTPGIDRARRFDGQRFCHYGFTDGNWFASGIAGVEEMDTGIHEATDGAADVRFLKIEHDAEPDFPLDACAFCFGFILDGHTTLMGDDDVEHMLSTGDAFTVSQGVSFQLLTGSEPVKLMIVSMPAALA